MRLERTNGYNLKRVMCIQCLQTWVYWRSDILILYYTYVGYLAKAEGVHNVHSIIVPSFVRCVQFYKSGLYTKCEFNTRRSKQNSNSKRLIW